MAETSHPAPTERMTFEEMGRRYIQHLEEVMQRKRTTIQDYRIMLLRHLGPFFGAKEVAKLVVKLVDNTPTTVETLVRCRNAG